MRIPMRNLFDLKFSFYQKDHLYVNNKRDLQNNSGLIDHFANKAQKFGIHRISIKYQKKLSSIID